MGYPLLFSAPQALWTPAQMRVPGAPSTYFYHAGRGITQVTGVSQWDPRRVYTPSWSQGVGANQIAYGVSAALKNKPVLLPDAVNDYMTWGGSSFAASAGLYLAAVVTAPSPLATVRVLGSSSASGQGYWGLAILSTGVADFFLTNTSSTPQRATTAYTIAAGQPGLLEGLIYGTNIYVNWNNQGWVSAALTSPSAVNMSPILASIAGSASFWSGAIASVIIAPGATAMPDRTKLLRYCRREWGLPV